MATLYLILIGFSEYSAYFTSIPQTYSLAFGKLRFETERLNAHFTRCALNEVL
jgi:hypothetical protein